MDLIEFARTLPKEPTDQIFISQLRKVLDLDQIRSLPEGEAQNLFDAVQFLTDYLLLHQEFLGVEKRHEGQIMVEYSGPYIENRLTRPPGSRPDFSFLETFGVSAD
ncbi:hypothetical protein [Ascidiaceihabitans sp.]|uniref:hypothetical protein n=1 Tax=Ascidiaceihabitans sp. TaxID=1872644 RepID=UPI003297598A